MGGLCADTDVLVSDPPVIMAPLNCGICCSDLCDLTVQASTSVVLNSGGIIERALLELDEQGNLG